MDTFLLASNACGRTYGEVSQRIQTYLVANGMRPTDDVGRADLLLVDTCGFCQAAEDHSMGLVRTCLDRRHPGAKVLVVGCLPGINPTRLASVDDIHVLGLEELGRLDEITGATVAFDTIRTDIATNLPVQPTPAASGAPRKAFNITTSTGCLHDCTFCAVKQVWGRLRSRPVNSLVAELEAGLAAGHEMFYLAAQDLGAYGFDLRVSVVDLLEGLFAVDGTYRLILHDFNPQWLIKHQRRLEPLLVQHADKIAYLDVPLQSGSDRVLQRMKRPYQADEVRRFLFSLKQAVPDLIVELDVLMGFPGETADDFAQTVSFVESTLSLPSMCYWLSGYSDRPGTAASHMTDKIDEAVVMDRFLALRRLVEGGPGRLGTGMVYYEGYRL